LVFGASYIAPRDDVVVLATLPLPVVAIKFIPPARAELLAELPGLTVRTLLLRPSVPLNVALWRKSSRRRVLRRGPVLLAHAATDGGQTAHPWQLARQTEDGATQGQQDAPLHPQAGTAFWRRTLALFLKASSTGCRRCWQPRQSNAAHRPAACDPLQDSTWFAHQDATRFEAARRGLFQNAGPLRDATRFRHQDGDRTKRAGRVSRWQSARVAGARPGERFSDRTAATKGLARPVSGGGAATAGHQRWVIPEPPVPQPCYTPSPHLLFAALAAPMPSAVLCENHITPPPPDGEPVVVPVRRVYFVINNVTLHRVSDGAPVPVFNLSLSLDASSWAWGFDAVLPARAEAWSRPAAHPGPSNSWPASTAPRFACWPRASAASASLVTPASASPAGGATPFWPRPTRR
jgi:hypothetical protein